MWVENAGYFLIKTPQKRGFLLKLLSVTTRPERALMRRALYFLKCLGAVRIVVSLEILF